jgi:hypothetical protein
MTSSVDARYVHMEFWYLIEGVEHGVETIYIYLRALCFIAVHLHLTSTSLLSHPTSLSFFCLLYTTPQHLTRYSICVLVPNLLCLYTERHRT